MPQAARWRWGACCRRRGVCHGLSSHTTPACATALPGDPWSARLPSGALHTLRGLLTGLPTSGQYLRCTSSVLFFSVCEHAKSARASDIHHACRVCLSGCTGGAAPSTLPTAAALTPALGASQALCLHLGWRQGWCHGGQGAGDRQEGAASRNRGTAAGPAAAIAAGCQNKHHLPSACLISLSAGMLVPLPQSTMQPKQATHPRSGGC